MANSPLTSYSWYDIHTIVDYSCLLTIINHQLNHQLKHHLTIIHYQLTHHLVINHYEPCYQLWTIHQSSSTITNHHPAFPAAPMHLWRSAHFGADHHSAGSSDDADAQGGAHREGMLRVVVVRKWSILKILVRVVNDDSLVTSSWYLGCGWYWK